MPPKKKPEGPSKKTEQKRKEKVIEVSSLHFFSWKFRQLFLSTNTFQWIIRVSAKRERDFCSTGCVLKREM